MTCPACGQPAAAPSCQCVRCDREDAWASSLIRSVLPLNDSRYAERERPWLETDAAFENAARLIEDR